MLAGERRQLIVDALRRDGSVSSALLARSLRVSEMTVRRDLDQLAREGNLVRVHGGAHLAGAGRDTGFSDRRHREHEAKVAIAAAASRLVRDGESVYLDAGTTTTELAMALRTRPLQQVQVVTHAVNIAAALSGLPQFTVVQIGGEIYQRTFSAVGDSAVEAIRRLSIDRLFLACQGFDLHGVGNPLLAEVAVKAAAIRAARWVCLVADASKWGHASFARVADLEQVHCIVTDSRLPPEARQELQTKGVEVVIGDTATRR
jgi:DeoR/GlpR family transcriptional regulator of sugar metabolism